MNTICQQLACGLEVVTQQMGHVDLAFVAVNVPIGSMFEQDATRGICHAIEHMLFKGSQLYPTPEILMQNIERTGGMVNAYTTFDHTQYYVVCQKEFVVPMLQLLTDMVFNPLFPEEDWQREREVIFEEIKRGKDSWGYIMSQDNLSVAYQNSGYQHPIIGYEPVLSALSSQDLQAFHAKYYTPARSQLCVMGQFDTEQVQQWLYAYKPAVQTKQTPINTIPLEPPNLFAFENPILVDIAPRVALAAQTHYNVSWRKTRWPGQKWQLSIPIPHGNHALVAAFDILSTYLGQNDTSPLVQQIKYSTPMLATEVECSAFTPLQAYGIFTLFIQSSHTPIETIIQIFCQALQDLETGMAVVSPTRLQSYKDALHAHRVYSQESITQSGRSLLYSLLTPEKLDHDKQYLKKVDAVTPADLCKTAVYLKNQLLNQQWCVTLLEGDDSDTFMDTPLAPGMATQLAQTLQATIQATFQPVEQTQTAQTKTNLQKQIFYIPNPANPQQDHQLLIYKNTNLPIVSGFLGMLGGNQFETPDNFGIHTLVANSITSGTKTHSRDSFAETLENMVSSIQAFSGRDAMGVKWECLSKYQHQTFNLMLDCLLHPSLEETNWRILQQETWDKYKQLSHNPKVHIFWDMLPFIYQGTSYKSPLIGTKHSLDCINNEHIQQAFQTYWSLHSSTSKTIVLVGDITDEAIQLYIDTLTNYTRLAPKLPSLNSGSETARIARLPELPTSSHSLPITGKHANTSYKIPLHFVTRHIPAQQNVVVVSFPIPKAYTKESLYWELLELYMSGMEGPLYKDLREKQSLAYSKEIGVCSLQIGCSVSKTRQSIQGLVFYVREILQGRVGTQEDFTRSLFSYKSRYLMDQTYNSAKASQQGVLALHGQNLDTDAIQFNAIQQISLEQMEQYFAAFMPQHITIGVGGDVDALDFSFMHTL
jgi:zinc protease